VDILEIDVVTGKKTALALYARKALRALKAGDVPFAVIGAEADAATTALTRPRVNPRARACRAKATRPTS
jgi:hypothetical protein